MKQTKNKLNIINQKNNNNNRSKDGSKIKYIWQIFKYVIFGEFVKILTTSTAEISHYQRSEIIRRNGSTINTKIESKQS